MPERQFSIRRHGAPCLMDAAPCPTAASVGSDRDPSYFTPVGLTQRTRQATPCVEELKLQYPSALVVTVFSVAIRCERLGA